MMGRRIGVVEILDSECASVDILFGLAAEVGCSAVESLRGNGAKGPIMECTRGKGMS